MYTYATTTNKAEVENSWATILGQCVIAQKRAERSRKENWRPKIIKQRDAAAAAAFAEASG
jgi:hypothetical protein